MPAPLRSLFPKTLVLISTRIEEGLPLVCTEYMAAIIWSTLARAQSLYPITACHFISMTNHLHLLAVVRDPNDVVSFMDRIKTESSHAINRLLGRRQRTVWQDGYDSQTILTLEDAAAKIVYLYTNPQRANLVSKIEDYPGVSSWQMWQNGSNRKGAGWIQRPAITKLKQPVVNQAQDRAITEELTASCKVSHIFTIEPNAWCQCFGITEEAEIEALNRQIMDGIRAEEAALTAQRKTPVIGAEKLRRQSIDKAYSPKKFAKRMWCICHDIDLRKQFIEYVKDLKRQARAVLDRWRLGDFAAKYPIGLFPPSLPRNANLPSLVFAEI